MKTLFRSDQSDQCSDFDTDITKINVLRVRASIYQHIRHFFEQRNVWEVDTPILSFAGNPDPALHSFITQYHGPGSRFNQQFYLNTSPEFCMKRLLASKSGAIYSICKVFRDGEFGARHNPEFSMLEWYQPNYSLADLMDESVDLIRYLYVNMPKIASKIAFKIPLDLPMLNVRRVSYRQLFIEMLGLDPMTATIPMLESCIAAHHIALTFLPEDTDEWLDLIMSHLIEPKINPNELTLVYHYPASQASLAKTCTEDGYLVGERVEIYWKGLELANGFHELTDKVEQRVRFIQNNEMRIKRGLEPLVIDDALLKSLENMPDCSGIAFGLDRVIMCLLGLSHISDVVSFDIECA